MRINQDQLIDDLISRTEHIISQAEMYKSLPADHVNLKPNPEKWSVLECLEHLNLYGDFYLVEIEQRILSSNDPPKKLFKSGWFGNYAANSMLPKNGKIMKMKTFRDKDPSNSNLDQTTIDRFLKQQSRMIDLLHQARKINLTRVKTSITIPIIKFRLGDTFRFVIYHNQRHMIQASNVQRQFSDGQRINHS